MLYFVKNRIATKSGKSVLISFVLRRLPNYHLVQCGCSFCLSDHYLKSRKSGNFILKLSGKSGNFCGKIWWQPWKNVKLSSTFFQVLGHDVQKYFHVQSSSTPADIVDRIRAQWSLYQMEEISDDLYIEDADPKKGMC